MERRGAAGFQYSLYVCLAVSFTIYLVTWLPHNLKDVTKKGWSFSGRHGAMNNADPKRVLVTGAAGFIGFHVAKRLAEDPANVVIAMDNFNDYYDVQLKIDRAYELHKAGVLVFHEDVCNTAFLTNMFVLHKFTHVVHLAAQAGVRYSLHNPKTYVHFNVECQLVLMEVLQQHKGTKLIYASSSSVYGKNAKVPFHVSADADKPGNMYAATKRADELLAKHYCLAHNLSAVGLRFFTVYGPWGRPDMAVYKFTESIVQGKEVPLFFISDDQPLGRDFTYVDDIIDGVISALDYESRVCGEKFNLGAGKPYSTLQLVDELEQLLGLQAHVKKLPLPPTEIIQTWADIDASRSALHFNPKIPFKAGLSQFVQWYKSYIKKRTHDEIVGETPSHVWFQKLFQDKLSRGKIYEGEALVEENHNRRQRLNHEKQKYLSWAQDHGIDTSVNIRKQFNFFQGMDSPGGDMIQEPGLHDDIEALQERCLEVEQCVAFNTAGALKHLVLPQARWTREASFSGTHQGLYASDIDMCHSDLHDCHLHASCKSVVPAQYECTCDEGYHGNGQECVPIYMAEGPMLLDLKQEYTADTLSFHSRAAMKNGSNMVFFQGMDSPGGNLFYAGGLSAGSLKDLCMKDSLCIAVNTKGMVKRMVQPPNTWQHWTDTPGGGIWIFDINYCVLWEEACPAHASCTRQEAGQYGCTCEGGYVMLADTCVQQPPG